MYQRLPQNRAKEKELGPKLKSQTEILLSLNLLAWGVRLEVPRTRTSSVSSDPSRTFSSSPASHLAWMGESNLKLGTVEVGGGSLRWRMQEGKGG